MRKTWSWYCVLISCLLITMVIILNHLLTLWSKQGKQALNYMIDTELLANTSSIDPRKEA